MPAEPLPISEIKTKDDARAFFRHLFAVEKVLFHPDDSFHKTIVRATGAPFYTSAEANVRDELMDQCFGVCDPYDDAIEVGQECGVYPKDDAPRPFDGRA